MGRHKLECVFRVFPEGDVIALFTDDIRGVLMGSYQHVGQHGDASIDLMDELRAATLEESEDLKQELTSIGYDWTEVDRKAVSNE